eukprot:7654792-Pyramimonas_sp.AAC.3
MYPEARADGAQRLEEVAEGVVPTIQHGHVPFGTLPVFGLRLNICDAGLLHRHEGPYFSPGGGYDPDYSRPRQYVEVAACPEGHPGENLQRRTHHERLPPPESVGLGGHHQSDDQIPE